MSVKITKDTKPGDLYVDEQGQVHRIFSFFTMPSIEMENVFTGSQTYGGVGSRNLEPFKPIHECDKDELISSIEMLARECRKALDERIRLKEKVIALAEKMLEEKYKALNNEKDH